MLLIIPRTTNPDVLSRLLIEFYTIEVTFSKEYLLNFHFLDCDGALVVPESSHPLRPVFLNDAAGRSPVAGSVEVAMPFQSPQLLESDLPDRPIHKNAVNITFMPIDTEMRHPALPGHTRVHTIIIRRPIPAVRSAGRHHAIQKKRYIAGIFNEYGLPAMPMPARS